MTNIRILRLSILSAALLLIAGVGYVIWGISTSESEGREDKGGEAISAVVEPVSQSRAEATYPEESAAAGSVRNPDDQIVDTRTPLVTRGNETSDWEIYRNEEIGFEFRYPPDFGIPSAGTSRDFPGTGDKGYAIRFSQFSSGAQNETTTLEGEAVITRGRIWVIGRALGGLHDSIVLGGIIEALPELLRATILEHSSSLGSSNFCAELSEENHIDTIHPSLISMSSTQTNVLTQLDRIGNIDPKVIRCEPAGNTITFHKVAGFESGDMVERQHIYGAIRFLEAPFSSFQLIRVTNEPPSEQVMATMTGVVDSVRTLD